MDPTFVSCDLTSLNQQFVDNLLTSVFQANFIKLREIQMMNQMQTQLGIQLLQKILLENYLQQVNILIGGDPELGEYFKKNCPELSQLLLNLKAPQPQEKSSFLGNKTSREADEKWEKFHPDLDKNQNVETERKFPTKMSINNSKIESQDKSVENPKDTRKYYYCDFPGCTKKYTAKFNKEVI